MKWSWKIGEFRGIALYMHATFLTVFGVIVGTASKVLSNYTNHVAQTPLDKVFAKNAWSADAQPVG